MKDRFTLEQEIMNCWHIVDDLQVLLDKWDSITEDEKLNIIIGLSSLYQLKFDTLFRTFETCIRMKEFKPSSYEEALNKDYADDLARTYGLKGYEEALNKDYADDLARTYGLKGNDCTQDC